MKLYEITKDEFVDKLKDPLKFKIKEHINKLRATLRSTGYKISRVKYIHHKEWNIIKFVVFFSENEEIKSDNSTRLQRLVFNHFVGLVIPKMSDAVFLKDPSRILFIYFLR